MAVPLARVFRVGTMSWLGEAGSEVKTEAIVAAGCHHRLVQGVKTVCQQSWW